ncbi:MAG: hypothetical protein DRO09_02960 [Thermoprotei archaeon]|nr:MAG: hypothetical protein DRO09_02960 [Thermoprotei archaeon]
MGEELLKTLMECLDRFGDLIGLALYILSRYPRSGPAILKTLALNPKPLYTRQLLDLAATSWGKAGRVRADTEATLRFLEEQGLIRRWEEECWIESKKKTGLKVKTKCKFNEITWKGRLVYSIIAKLEELGLIEI